MKQDEREQITAAKICADIKEELYLSTTTMIPPLLLLGFVWFIISLIDTTEMQGLSVFMGICWGLCLLVCVWNGLEGAKYIRLVRTGAYRIVEESVADIRVKHYYRHSRIYMDFPISGTVEIDERTRDRTVIGETFYLVLTNEKKPRILQFYNQLSYRL